MKCVDTHNVSPLDPMRPTCMSCGWHNTRPSTKRSFDFVLGGLLLDPYRCLSCNSRFHRFRYTWAKIAIPMMLLVITACTFMAAGYAVIERHALKTAALRRLESLRPNYTQAAVKGQVRPQQPQSIYK